jgi:hypothetical protein
MCFKSAWVRGRTVKGRSFAARANSEHLAAGVAAMGAKMGSQPKTVMPSAAIEDRETSALMLDLMLEALRLQNDRLNTIAIELFGRMGEHLIRSLVLEATNRKNRPKHRLRILQAIQRIGGLSDVVSYIDFFTLVRDPNPAIRQEAMRTISALHGRFPGQTDKICELAGDSIVPGDQRCPRLLATGGVPAEPEMGGELGGP